MRLSTMEYVPDYLCLLISVIQQHRSHRSRHIFRVKAIEVPAYSNTGSLVEYGVKACLARTSRYSAVHHIKNRIQERIKNSPNDTFNPYLFSIVYLIHLITYFFMNVYTPLLTFFFRLESV